MMRSMQKYNQSEILAPMTLKNENIQTFAVAEVQSLSYGLNRKRIMIGLAKENPITGTQNPSSQNILSLWLWLTTSADLMT